LFEVDLCCFNDVCTTEDEGLGHAIHADGSNSVFNATRSSFIDFGWETLTAQGTIVIDKKAPFSFGYLNFSESHLSLDSNDAGLGFICWLYQGHDQPWSFRYGTVLKCSGSSGIHDASTVVGTVECCNFYDNTARSDWAVLSSWGTGMSVQNCIFKGNNKDIMLSGTGTGTKFVLTGCVFWGLESSISSDYIDGLSSTDNWFEITTASHTLLHLDTHYCPASAPSPTCYAVKAPFSSRIEVPQSSSCVVVEDCVFMSLSGSSSGGAGYFGTSISYVDVFGSTFADVRCSYRGGALYFESDSHEVGCCFIDVSAGEVTDSCGHALASNLDQSTFDVNSSSFVECGSQTSLTAGVLCVDKDTHFYFTSLNFSECRLSADLADGGAAIGFIFYDFINRYNPWYLRYCTVLKCSGSTGIHHSDSGDGTVEYCNFYGNVARADRGVLFTFSHGLNVQYCVFEGNSREIFMATVGSVKFSMIGCVLSSPEGSIPSAYFDGASSGNVFGMTTASYVITHSVPAECRTSTPTPTPLGTATTSANCKSYEGQFQAPINVTETFACVLISDSFFENIIGSGARGAVTIGEFSGPLFVRSVTFINCSTPHAYFEAHGGAIYVGTSLIEVDRCCFIETESEGRGSAIFIEATDTVNKLENSNFGDCGDPSSPCDGTICFWNSVFITLNSLNFSECTFAQENTEQGRGYVFYSPENDGDAWTVRYCTVVKCSGTDAIHSSKHADGTVEYCNFYGNAIHSNTALLYAWQSGFAVRFCVFEGSAREFYIEDNPDPIFQIVGCVFSSASFPESHFEANAWGNRFGVFTASLVLPHLSSEDCGAKVIQTPSPTRGIGVFLM
jgi:hypothetical protein